jgi:hypothetical protein
VIPILNVLMTVLFAGTAVWYLRYRFDRKEPSVWFFAWLVAAAASSAFGAASWWISDNGISEGFWVASAVCLSLTVFLIFAFARSFATEAGYTLVFWSVPLMFDVALIIYNSEVLFVRSGNGWVPKDYSTAFYVHVAIVSFYALLAIYHAVMLYVAMRSQAQRQELNSIRLILGGLIITFAAAVAGGWVRMSVNEEIPIIEVGMIVGALLIVLGIVGPWPGSGRDKKIEGET